MRVTQVTRSERSWSPLVLHPRLTVISGEESQRAEVVSTLTSLYSEAGAGVGGVLEFSGLTMPIDQTAVVSLDLHGAGLPRLDAEAVQEALARTRAAARESSEARLAVLDQVDSTLAGREAELRRRRTAAHAAVVACEEEIERTTEQLERIELQLEEALSRPPELDAELESLRGQRSVLQARSARARDHLDDLLAVLGAPSAALGALRLGSTDRNHEEVRAALGTARELGLLDAASAEHLGTWLDEVSAGTAPASATIASMIEEIEDLEQKWEQLAATGVEGDPSVTAARETAEAASRRHDALAELADSGLLASRARDEIDAAHEAGDPVAEAEVLGAYGFGSHLDYTIAVSTRSVGEAVGATMERARAEMVRAHDVLEAERERAAAVRSELGARRDSLRERIRVATGTEPESLAREELERIVEPPVEHREIESTMRACLQAADVECERLDEEVSELLAERDALVDPDELRAELTARRGQIDALEPLTQRARDEIAELDAEAERIEQERAQLAPEREELHQHLELPGAHGEPSTTELAMLAAVLGEQLATGGPGRSGEPAPVLLEDSLAVLGGSAPDVLEALMEAAPEAQLVYVTEDPLVLAWAKRHDQGSLAVHRLGRRRWFGRMLARSPRESENHPGREAADR
ncbi:MAG: hypothetical protein R2716_01455 [Microthrixaceae bacterium]